MTNESIEIDLFVRFTETTTCWAKNKKIGTLNDTERNMIYTDLIKELNADFHGLCGLTRMI